MNLFKTMRDASNLENAEPMSAYMRNQFPFLGIKTPERKKILREYFKTIQRDQVDWTFVLTCWEQPEREFQYAALDYLKWIKSNLTPKDIPHLAYLIETKSWWDTIDALDKIVGSIALRHPEVNETLLAWSEHENFWFRRIAIDHQLGRKGETNTKLLEQIIKNNFGQTEFFINKAIGWSLREYSKTNPDWVRLFIDENSEYLAKLSIREASKYL